MSLTPSKKEATCETNFCLGVPFYKLPLIPDGFYWIDTGYACGGVTILDGRIVDDETTQIFRKLEYWPKKWRKIS